MSDPMWKIRQAFQEEHHLKDFDPRTFYPALSAREKMRQHRNESLTPFPHKELVEPSIPPDFDPAVFYPALAAREKASLAAKSKGGSSFSDEESICRIGSLGQTSFTRVGGGAWVGENVTVITPDLHHSESWVQSQRKANRKKLLIVASILFLLTVTIVVILAWLGSHNWLQSQPVRAP